MAKELVSQGELAQLREVLKLRFGSSGLLLRNSLAEQINGDGLLDHCATVRYWVDNLDLQIAKIALETIDFKDGFQEDGCGRQYLLLATDSNATEEEVKSFLLECHVIEWAKPRPILFGALDLRWKSALAEVAEQRGGSMRSSGKDDLFIFNGQLPPTEPADKLPAGYRLETLSTPEHADSVNSLWKFGSEETLGYTRDIIRSAGRLKGACGVFYDSPGSGPSVLASCGSMQAYGAIGMIMTAEKHQRRGLANVVTHCLVRWALSRDWVPFCIIERDNDISVRAFEKIGFRRVEGLEIAWMFFLRKSSSESSTTAKLEGLQKHIPGTCL